MRFCLDEHLSQRIADICRSRGLDVISSHECGRDGLSDADRMRLAASEGRCFVTRNHAHFVELTRTFREMGWPHAGVLLVAPSLTDPMFADIALAPLDYNQEHPEGLLPYQTDYIRRPIESS